MPRPISKTEVMQTTAGLHNHIMNTFSPLTKLVFDDTITFHTANHVFNMNADAINSSILFFLFVRQRSITRFFLWLENDNACWSEALKSHVLPQYAPFRKLIRFTISDVLVMTFSFPRRAQASNVTEDIGDQNILNGVLPFLSAVIQLLFIRIRRSIYRSFCSVMEKKGVSCMVVGPGCGGVISMPRGRHSIAAPPSTLREPV